MTSWAREVFVEMTRRDYFFGVDPAAGPDKTVLHYMGVPLECDPKVKEDVLYLIGERQVGMVENIEVPKRCMCWHCRALAMNAMRGVVRLEALPIEPAHNECAVCQEPARDGRDVCSEACNRKFDEEMWEFFLETTQDDLISAIDAVHAARRDGSLRYWLKE